MLNFKFLTFHFIVVLLPTLFVLNVNSEESPQACLIPERNEIEQYLSTKTPYRVVANFNETSYDYEGCRPTRIWSVIRHGSRNPSREIITRARTDLVEIQKEILSKADTKFCDEELKLLRAWNFNISGDEEKFLVAEGEDELIELAERMQKRFPELLNREYHPDSFYFKYTKTQRTLKSAQHFAIGLFGRDRINEIIYPEALHKDPVLRPFKL